MGFNGERIDEPVCWTSARHALLPVELFPDFASPIKKTVVALRDHNPVVERYVDHPVL
jgi:hypothetical protein